MKDKMKKAIIFCNGNLPQAKKILNYISKTDFIVCANGGIKHALKLGLVPNVIIGDHDSLPPFLKEKLKKHSLEWIKYPLEKDQTDSELAIEYAIKKGFKKILAFGAFGTRIDHSIANLLFLASPNYKAVDITIIEGNQEIFLVKNRRIVEGKKGDFLSLIPLQGNCLGVTSKGLKWQLKNSVLYFSSTLGISNVLTHSQTEIKIKKGVLLAIHTRF